MVEVPMDPWFLYHMMIVEERADLEWEGVLLTGFELDRREEFRHDINRLVDEAFFFGTRKASCKS